MARRGIRSTLQRFVVGAGLATALLVGSIALGPQSDAVAMPMSCSTALALARENINIGNVFLAYGDPPPPTSTSARRRRTWTSARLRWRRGSI
jgi:hypothetical protein